MKLLKKFCAPKATIWIWYVNLKEAWVVTEKTQNEILCLIKDILTVRKQTYFSPSFDGAKKHKAV